MSGSIRRREFLAAAIASPLLRAGGIAPTPAALPFTPAEVTLTEGPFYASQELNRAYLRSLDPDRLLHMFRLTAGIPSKAAPLGGWEKPDVELRGHFTGHYLSSTALFAARAQPDAKLRQYSAYVVHALAQCQKAHGNGYVSAFPESFFTRLEEGKKVWAPFYTIHKILAGLLDQYTLCGNREALEVAQGIAQWTASYTRPLDDAAMARIEKVEFGGMAEGLYNLFGITSEPSLAALAHRFDQPAFLDPLAEGRDELTGLHVNTNIPKVIGAARRYELLGDPRDRRIAEYFWSEVVGKRSYVTGGTSNGELWRAPAGQLASQLGPTTQECCCTYNLLKLTGHLYGWTASPHYAAYYERALFNSILGTMHPGDGLTMYYVPLAGGYWKIFGLPLDSFWCCTGTGTESFAKLPSNTYFHDSSGVWVNLFLPTRLNWTARRFALRQQTRFPDEPSSTLIVDQAPSEPLALRIRVPEWTGGGFRLRLNGEEQKISATPGEYVTLERSWKTGDRIELGLPMSLHAQAMPDDASVQAILYGPLVLAGDLGRGDVPESMRRGETIFASAATRAPYRAVVPRLQARGESALAGIRRTGAPLTFYARGDRTDVTLMPLNRIVDQRYAVYWRIEPA